MTATRRNTDGAFAGVWRIVETALWAEDALDMIQPAFVRFDDECIGSLGMIAIEAGIDCRFGMRGGRPLVELTFEGDDDGHPCSGRASATIDPDGSSEVGCSSISATTASSLPSARRLRRRHQRGHDDLTVRRRVAGKRPNQVSSGGSRWL